MYGKYHASAFTGSMRGAGPVMFSVWGYVISNANQVSVVELNPEVVAFLIGCTPSEVEEAITALCLPDARSRSKEYDGRRLIKEGEFQYFVPTHAKYRAMKTTEDKREYNRLKKQEQRAREASVKPNVKNVKNVNTTEAYPEAYSEEVRTHAPPEVPRARNTSNGDVCDFLKEKGKLQEMYSRGDRRWTYNEESLFFELSSRENFKSEVEALAHFQANLPRDEQRYFPNSLARLLERWSETLDRVTVKQSSRPLSIIEQDINRI